MANSNTIYQDLGNYLVPSAATMAWNLLAEDGSFSRCRMSLWLKNQKMVCKTSVITIDTLAGKMKSTFMIFIITC